MYHGLLEFGKEKMMIKRLCAAVLALCMLNVSAMAETVRGDLSSRFASESTITYQGEEYQPRNRLMTMLVTCIANLDDETVTRFHYLLVFDDDQKLTTKFRFEDNTLLEIEGENGEKQCVAMNELLGLNEDRSLGGTDLTAALSELLGVEIEYYMAFDLDGLTILSGNPDDANEKYSDDAALRARMSEILNLVQQKTSREVSELYSDLGDYLVTNMKSGAAMKAYDKLDRYERTETILPEGMLEECANEEGELEMMVRVDVESIRAQLIEAFYMPKVW